MGRFYLILITIIIYYNTNHSLIKKLDSNLYLEVIYANNGFYSRDSKYNYYCVHYNDVIITI